MLRDASLFYKSQSAFVSMVNLHLYYIKWRRGKAYELFIAYLHFIEILFSIFWESARSNILQTVSFIFIPNILQLIIILSTSS
jgi:hypothetical protein